MKTYIFKPANPLSQIGHGPDGRERGRAGDTVTLTDEKAAYIIASYDGVDGKPCLEEVKPTAKKTTTKKTNADKTEG